MMNKAGAVVEFQAFRGEHNEYVLKEFTAVDLTTDRFVLVLFAPPYDSARLPSNIQKSNEWLVKHYHRLRWNDGNVPYKDMVRIVAQICSEFSVIYTKGLEKTNFIRQYYHHGDVIDLNDMNAPVVSRSYKPTVKCPVSHHSTLHCPLRKALFYANWLKEQCK